MAYPEYILKKLRQREDLEATDKSKDNIFNQLSPDQVFDEVCNWEGLINYSHTIKRWVKDVYGINLNGSDK
jgi:hypothetical protein